MSNHQIQKKERNHILTEEAKSGEAKSFSRAACAYSSAVSGFSSAASTLSSPSLPVVSVNGPDMLMARVATTADDASTMAPALLLQINQ